jgi:outer membrane protein TolC
MAALLFLTAATPVHAEDLRLSLEEAVHRALRDGTSSEMARSAEEQARAAMAQARSALLPRSDARLLRINQSINLETFGFSVPGEPPVVGPFNVTDAQITAAMQLFDLAALRRYQAAREGLPVARYLREQAENDVAAAVARMYLLAEKASAQVEVRSANVKLFEELSRLAADQFKAGVATRLDTARADVQLARERQALLVASNQSAAARLALLHAMGADQSSNLELTDAPFQPAPPPSAGEALQLARQQRPELKAAAARKRAAELALSAARSARLPTVGVDFAGDYSGLKASDLRWSRRVAAGATIPIFAGGRITAALAEAKEQEHQAGIQQREAEQSVEEDVRRSVLAVESARDRVTVARETVHVAEEELTVARDRYTNGVGSSIEVDRSEDSYRQAREDLIAAESDAAIAGFDLQHATGEIRQFTGGTNP